MLHLDPEDWLYATWRPREIRIRPDPPPFTVESGLKRLERFTKKAKYHRPWIEARMATAMIPEEARFWLGAMLAIAGQERAHYWMTQLPESKDLLIQALRTDLNRTPPIGEVIERINGAGAVWVDLSAAVLLPLSILYTWDEVLEFLAKVTWRPQGRHLVWNYDHVFRRRVLPYLSEDEFVRLRETIRKDLDPSSQGDFRETIAPLLGLHREMLAYIPQRRTLHYIFGLGSAQEVRDSIASHNFNFQPDMVRAWFAHMELDNPRPLTEALLRMGKTDGHSVVQEFASVVSAPVAAPEFLLFAEDGKHLVEARKWFDAHPHETIDGLAGETSGSSKKAALARSIVQGLRRKLGELPEEAPEVDATISDLPEGLAQAFATARAMKVKEPRWVSARELPPILLEAGRLSEGQVTFLLGLLAAAPGAPPHPLFVALRCYATPESLDTFAEALFNQWREAGMSGKEKWALLALGALGSDRCALRLAPYVKEWPGQSKHQAAAWGLECLRLIGTDTAIMQINQIAQKTKFQALKKNAQQTMEGIAEDRGLTRDELEDRIVPDCGLDALGSRLFDFGPRQFLFRIGPDLKPLLIDADWKHRDDLPKPSAKDDAAKAKEAVSEWKLLKKQVSEVMKSQVARMEQALITQRRWSAADFRALLVEHPIVAALIRPLVWGVFNASNRPIASFRVAEDLTYTDSRDEAFELLPDGSIGVLHPAHMEDAVKARWGELLADYELIQPFPQLSRVLHRLTAKELADSEIVRHTEARLKPIVFAGIAKRLGYAHGVVGDGGTYFTHAKWFNSAGITAVLQHSWLSIGYYETDPVSLEKAYFVPEKFGRGGWAEESRNKVPLREVDEVVVSEILNDMAVLALRAEGQ